jgi:vitamin B12 transporter
VTLDSYILLNAAGFYEVFEPFGVFLRLDNILNVNYETIKGYATAGFSIYAGIRANF